MGLEPAKFKNNTSTCKHLGFVISEIKELLRSGRIRKVPREEDHMII